MNDILKVSDKVAIFASVKQSYLGTGNGNIITAAPNLDSVDIYMGRAIKVGDIVCNEFHYNQGNMFFVEVTEQNISPMTAGLTTKFVIISKKVKNDYETMVVFGNEKISRKVLDDGHTQILMKIDEVKEPMLFNIVSNRVYFPYLEMISEKETVQTALPNHHTSFKVEDVEYLSFYKELVSLLTSNIFLITGYKDKLYKIPIKDFKLKSTTPKGQPEGLDKKVLIAVNELTPYELVPF